MLKSNEQNQNSSEQITMREQAGTPSETIRKRYALKEKLIDNFKSAGPSLSKLFQKTSELALTNLKDVHISSREAACLVLSTIIPFANPENLEQVFSSLKDMLEGPYPNVVMRTLRKISKYLLDKDLIELSTIILTFWGERIVDDELIQLTFTIFGRIITLENIAAKNFINQFAEIFIKSIKDNNLGLLEMFYYFHIDILIAQSGLDFEITLRQQFDDDDDDFIPYKWPKVFTFTLDESLQEKTNESATNNQSSASLLSKIGLLPTKPESISELDNNDASNTHQQMEGHVL